MDEKDSWLDGISAVTLKSLLENPNMLMPTGMMRGKNSEDPYNYQNKQKNVERMDDYSHPMSAFLGPKLWENTLPDNNDLKFEYMDIEEFLSEHGLSSGNEDGSSKTDNTTAPSPSQSMASSAQSMRSASASPAPAQTLASTSSTQPLAASATTQQLPPNVRENLCSSKEEEASTAALQVSCSQNPREAKGLENKPQMGQTSQPPPLPQASNPLSSPAQESDCVSGIPTPPREPSPVAVDVPFEVSSTDVALATVPGEMVFDPREKKFSDEELKPQPMIKKSRKVFVPAEQKDDKYWERRRKNNVAAKRSRDARRVKENQIVLRASFLESENGALKEEVIGLKKDNMSLKKVVANLEKQLRAVQAAKQK